MNETIRRLFIDFLETNYAGELVEEMHRISAEIDKQIESAAVEYDTIGDCELAASRFCFYAGFAAALELQAAKTRIAVRNRDRTRRAACDWGLKHNSAPERYFKQKLKAAA